MNLELTALAIEGYLKQQRGAGSHPIHTLSIPFMLEEWDGILAALRSTEANWRFAGGPEDSIELPDGPPMEAGTTLYTFDQRGTWFYDIPPLPSAPGEIK